MFGILQGNFTGGAVPFAFGNALEFDGVNDFVSFAPITLNNASTTSFWLNSSSSLVYPISSGSQYYFSVDRSNSRVLFREQTVNKIFNFPSIPLGWNNFVLTKASSSGVYRCYMNGIESTTGAIASTYTTLNFNRFFRLWTTTTYSAGILDEVIIKDGIAASSSDISTYYNGGLGSYSEVLVPSPNRIYRMNGTSGDSTAIDDGSDYENGTLNNLDTATCWVAH